MTTEEYPESVGVSRAKRIIERELDAARCWIIADRPNLKNARDREVFFDRADAERACNRLARTGKPYKVWPCRIAVVEHPDPGETR